ncbi:hypothetical protein CKO_01956 [Citrobacter koseri ATCC BAA-895]|uniref:Uncharacterized protein n=1 Tax=Citrobacter koseri (strain ATCC BAA-895 / CDC 4225-83 / SGSC4696) TaxID=290338 RepID=A8AHX0_CITK8|nr:hypothetical protein CKO_01956 [Citrobacter koseri ATCC BAA-895]
MGRTKAAKWLPFLRCVAGWRVAYPAYGYSTVVGLIRR